LILATGEQHPPGQSILARTVLIQLKRGDVDLNALTLAQRDAQLLPHAMSGYVSWLADRMGELGDELRERFRLIREHAVASGADGHLRVPEAIAHLWIGIELALEYALVIGACSEEGREALGNSLWGALCEGGSVQGRLVQEERPTLRFLRVLATLITQGRVFLVAKDDVGTIAKDRAEFLGWYDDTRLHLLPDAAFGAATRFARESGAPFPVRDDRLRRELAEEKLSEHDPARLLKTVRIGSETKKLLCLLRQPVGDALGEPFPVVPAVTSF